MMKTGSLLNNRRIARWLQRAFGRGQTRTPPPVRGSTVHVIILDGTMSSLQPGCESNAGLAFKLLKGAGTGVSVYYEPGIQWSHWKHAGDVFFGRGINRQIRRAYGYLASRYHPGDKIFLLGFSRGAYAVRSLAGVIDRVGLLRAERATQSNVRDAYRHYENATLTEAGRSFKRLNCHEDVQIEMIGAWDTVKSLGLNWPLVWRFSTPHHEFHNHHLGPAVKRGYHALARGETRLAYAPVMWETRPEWQGDLEQMWFRGTHGDVGGMLGGFEAARPLSNVALVWMLEKAEAAGLPLPEGWQRRYAQDPAAPSCGTFRGMGRYLIARRPRRVGHDPSEHFHPSITMAPERQGWHLPRLGSLHSN